MAAGCGMRARATWLLRVLWFLLPLTVGQAVNDGLDGAGNAVSNTMIVGLWVFWAVGLAAAAIPLPPTLTATRMLAPATIPLAVWAVATTDNNALAYVAVAHAIVTVVVAMSHLIGDRFVDGASYGDERRMLLRPPTRLVATIVPLVWLIICACFVAGPLLIADDRVVLGGVLSLVALAATVLGARAFHQLSRRWIVFVPTGFVLHDHSVMTEPVLFRQTAVERLGPAIAGSPARDLSNQAAGLLLECELTDPAPLGLLDAASSRTSSASGESATLTDVRRFLFAPTRPGELLDEAEARGLPVD